MNISRVGRLYQGMRSRRTDPDKLAQNDNQALLVLRQIDARTHGRGPLTHFDRVRLVEQLLDEIEAEDARPTKDRSLQLVK